jgi:uncharacterized delta-60 repeat protein
MRRRAFQTLIRDALVAVLAAVALAGCSGGGSDAGQVPAQPQVASGQLDSSYGNGGMVVASPQSSSMVTAHDGTVQLIGNEISRFDARGTAIGQPVWMFPTSFSSAPLLDDAGNFFAVVHDFAASRYHVGRFAVDGTLVTSYGDSGRARLDALANGNPVLGEFDLARDSAGNLFVGTYRFPQPGVSEVVVAKLDPSGRLDASFGDGGVAVVRPAGKSARTNAIVIDAAGNVFVAAYLTDDFRPVVVKLDSRGTPATNFASGGAWIPPACSSYLGAQDLMLDGAANILVAAQCDAGDGTLFKLDPAGNLVPSFGQGGTRPIGNGATQLYTVTALAIGPGGEIYAAGGGISAPGTCGKADLAVAKLDANGTLVTSFGSNGFVALPVSNDVYTDIAVDVQGGVHAGGATYSCTGRFATRTGFIAYRIGA